MESHQNQFFCDICNVVLNSKSQFDGHMSGQKHLRIINNINNNNIISLDHDIVMLSKNEYKCVICNVFLNGTVPVQDHLAGTFHLNKKERQNNKITFDDNIIIEKDTYFCKICNISCTGVIPMQSHVKGISHTKKIQIYV